jgi:hypothetical protein
MGRVTNRLLLPLLLAASAGGSLAAQEIVDRIVVRIENDVILQSDVDALKRYQLFVDGKSESDDAILDRLIDQWIVRTEADVSRFPRPAETEIQQSLERLRKSFTSAEEYETRKKQSGLDESELREMASLQLFLSNYLDSRFRPAVRVEPRAIEDFYQNAVVPRAKARGEEPPSLEAARDFIREALVQQGINEQANQWLKESRARLHIDKLPEGAAK